ncbi:uncharacterized protein LOC123517042 [Portunus trituberculatus]|uniref:uncharacterized protein LOC123517042 n=1 Tax=Portunus trituberculatus TaxID=210409 RepID=UPI001E1CC4F5|nr:uncharacterized protein LOC123517042 [Portunus trituberculatus]
MLHFPLKIYYVRILFICEYLYSIRYGSYDGVTDAVMPYRNSTVTVISEEVFVNLCVKHYNHKPWRCVEKRFMTDCLSDDVVFLHGHGCSRPSPNDAYFDQLLASTLLEEDELCFKAVCSGEVRAVKREFEGRAVHLFSPVSQHSACYKYLLLFHPKEKDNRTLSVLRNVQWPFCFAGYDVVWSLEAGDRDSGGEIIHAWSYLPLHCRITEQVMSAVMTLVVVGGVVGNMLVLIASTWRRHEQDHTVLMCVSLAAAELLVGVFVLAPGLHAHLKAMYGLADEEKASRGVSRGSNVQLFLEVGVEQLEGAFLVLSAHVLNVGCMVSLPTVLLLALERCLALNGKSLQEQLTMGCTRGFVVASWSLGVLVSMALVYGGGSFWYSFYKLPLSIPPGEPGMILAGVAVVLALLSGATVVVSFVALWRKFRGGAVGGTHRHAVPTRELLTALLHLGSAGTATSALLLGLTGIPSPYLEGARSVCWWGFLSFTFWHPWLLSLPHHHYRKAAMALADKCRRSWHCRLGGIPLPGSGTPSPPPSPRPPPRPGPKLAPGIQHRFLPGVRYYK